MVPDLDLTMEEERGVFLYLSTSPGVRPVWSLGRPSDQVPPSPGLGYWSGVREMCPAKYIYTCYIHEKFHWRERKTSGMYGFRVSGTLKGGETRCLGRFGLDTE